eukprot:CAMPEP_0113682022 /NCGR_PEP_ID=MMETSP0038_2-20120614/12379_1 /TAXON_ID=2898 /ORGANISM="Cryptomonas paramecium" /LENGTH=40 /DNA_ID=CAMNT_0000600939 /DNA_START=49 /DNA_END=167 /DNA_ORIENTATION=- /assembly_acc=CAM_ASM_000170
MSMMHDAMDAMPNIRRVTLLPLRCVTSVPPYLLASASARG